MDTLKQYIKMCDCPEIQDKWVPSKADVAKGDFVGFVAEANTVDAMGGGTYHSISLSRFSNDKDSFGKYAWYRKGELVWLPRQDQLQGMMGKYWRTQNLRFYCDVFAPTDKYYCKFDSMEQLWLGFAMHELHEKQWNGKRWIK